MSPGPHYIPDIAVVLGNQRIVKLVALVEGLLHPVAVEALEHPDDLIELRAVESSSFHKVSSVPRILRAIADHWRVRLGAIIHDGQW